MFKKDDVLSELIYCEVALLHFLYNSNTFLFSLNYNNEKKS